MNNSNIRYIYLRNNDNSPCGCVAIMHNKDVGTIHYGLSVLNPVDKFNFDRTVARKMAVGDMVVKQYTLKTRTGALTTHDITRSVYTDLLARSALPTRARKAARRWLQENEFRGNFLSNLLDDQSYMYQPKEA